jgi:hypothetical protein
MRSFSRVAAFLVFSFLVSGCQTMGRTVSTSSPAELAPLLVVSTPGESVQLICESGCAWTELSFAAVPDGPGVAVDEFGMTSVTRERERVEPDLSQFLFTVRRTTEGVELQGLEGFAWKGLGWECPENNCSIPIDQRGTR